MQPIIIAEGVSKKYTVNDENSFRTLRDSIADIFSAKSKRSRLPKTFWALDDISFTINAGESIGILGRNGAGKSTLLKIISRITKPTKGRLTLRGRVASLLEVGVGFHPELTGRENLFLNAAILGESRKNIQRKADEIIHFSGVERFLDTPIKRFSSGMRTRLGFAIASHSDGEILIVDEIIAVGDFEFQKKCTHKINEVIKSGRTILLVNHDMNPVKKLCSRIIHIAHGQLVNDTTDVNKGIKKYLQTTISNDEGKNT